MMNQTTRTIKSNYDESDYTPLQLVFDDDKRLSFRVAETLNDADSEGIHMRKIDRAANIIRNMLKERPIAVSEIIAECEKISVTKLCVVPEKNA